MTNLQLIYDTLNKPKIKELEKQTQFKPRKADHNVKFNDFIVPNRRNKANINKMFSKALAFIDMHKHLRRSDEVSIIPIATTNVKLLKVCNSPSGIKNLKDFLIEIGLISLYDNSYQFNAYNDKDNHCKLYAYNPDNEKLIKQYCADNGINKFEWKNYKEATNNIKSLDAFDKSQVKFNSKLHLLKPDNWSKDQFEQYLYNILYENYPQLKSYQLKADKLNEKLDEAQKIVFDVKFSWSKGDKAVNKIGIRATNSLVSCKKEKELDDPDWIVYRDDVLKELDYNYEYDVKSSVPRINYLLNNGVWLDDSIDLYEKMYNEFINMKPEEKLEWNKENRKIFKSLFMRGYFDTKSMIAGHIKYEIGKRVEYKRKDWQGIDNTMVAYKKAIENVIGSTERDSEIFLHESCIYMDVYEQLLNDGYNVLQVYDGFYMNKENKDIQKLIENKAMNYYNKYINNNNINKDNKESNIYNTIVKSFNIDISSLVDEALNLASCDKNKEKHTEKYDDFNENCEQLKKVG